MADRQEARSATFTQCTDCAWDICWQAESCRKKKLTDEEAESEQACAYKRRFSELAIAANQVLIGLRPIKSNGEYVNRFYGLEIERLDALVKEVLGDV